MVVSRNELIFPPMSAPTLKISGDRLIFSLGALIGGEIGSLRERDHPLDYSFIRLV